MKLPKLSNTQQLLQTYQVRFAGLNHTEGASDGEIYDMKNMTSDHYPVLCPREKRKHLAKINNATGGMISYGGVIVFVDGKTVCVLRQDGTLKTVGTLSEGGEKTFASFRDMVIILPDKKYVNISPLGDFSSLSLLATAMAGKEKYGDVYAVGIGVPYDLYYWNGSDWQEYGKEYGSLEDSVTTLGTFLYNGELYGEKAEANTLKGINAYWTNHFKVGDAVTISGCTEVPENNKTAIIRELDDEHLRFYENVFTFKPAKYVYTADKTLTADYGQLAMLLYYGFRAEGYEVIFMLPKDAPKGSKMEWVIGSSVVTLWTMGEDGWPEDPVEIQVESDLDFDTVNRELVFMEAYGDYEEPEPITVSRTVPDMDFMISDDNRLWGAKGNTIYGSKPGDPTNFNVFDGLSDDSYSVDIGNAGDITAALTYGGHPTFFKEDGIYRLYGDRPSNYQIMPTMKQGVKEGCAKSLAIAGEVLYYISRSGIMAYTGGVPTKVDGPLGIRVIDGVAVSDGQKYYISATEDGENYAIYVWDTAKGMWHKEDDLKLTYATYDKAAIALTADGDLLALTCGVGIGTEEEDVEWAVEFADMTFGSPFQKGVVKANIRFELQPGAEAKAEIRYDGGDWELIREFAGDGKRSNVLPVIPHRCDHFRLKLSGRGVCDIYSMALQYYNGSENY